MKEIISPYKMDQPICIALGFFDSVHMGHRFIIEKLKNNSKRLGCASAITTFSNNPYRQFNNLSKIIYTYPEREQILSSLDIDYVLPFKFDKTFKETSSADFLKMLMNYNIMGFVCGYDYLFGSSGQGNAQALTKFAVKNNIDIEVVNPVLYEGERVSSTIIKSFLLGGEIEKANCYLKQPFFICSNVVTGRGIGKSISMPTANMEIHKDKLTPKCGVYGTYTTIDGKRYKSVTNVGAKPTFSEMSISIETLIEGLNEDIYGKNINVEFIKYLRDIVKFDSPAELASTVQSNLKWS